MFWRMGSGDLAVDGPMKGLGFGVERSRAHGRGSSHLAVDGPVLVKSPVRSAVLVVDIQLKPTYT